MVAGPTKSINPIVIVATAATHFVLFGWRGVCVGRETIPFTRTMGPMRVLVVVYWRLDEDGLGHRKRLASSHRH